MLASLLASHARAQDKEVRPFIFHIELETKVEGPANFGSLKVQEFKDLVQDFKNLLRQDNYAFGECGELKHDIQVVVEQAPGSEEVLNDLQQRQDHVFKQDCTPPAGVVVYTASVSLTEDTTLNTRRAVLEMRPIGPGKAFSGSYANQPGELTDWDDVLAGVIKHTLDRVVRPTALFVRWPKDTTVGSTVHLDGSPSRNPDGDPFRLAWRITVPACRSGNRDEPFASLACPRGMQRVVLTVPGQAGQHDKTAAFRVPMVGDYEIFVHAQVGARDEQDGVLTIRADPRRQNAFFSRVSLLGLPRDFIRSTDAHQVGFLDGAGFVHRVYHHIGLVGAYEDIYIGGGFNSLQPLATFNFTAKANAVLASIEAVSRVMNRTGRYGLSNSLMLSGGPARSDRGQNIDIEAVWLVETALSFYFSFGENYVDRPSSYCSKVCPSFTVGPTLTALGNVTTGKWGLAGGTELFMGIEY